jgi:hypothetical protein
MRSLALAIPLSLAALVAAFASDAHAQDFEAAGKHFAAAQEAFGLKHFKVAATEFQAAYDITKDPVLLYNVAEAWERAGDGHRAVDAYGAYLKAQPNASDKAEVQKRIAAIRTKKFRLVDESALAEAGGEPAQKAAAPRTPPPTVAAPPPAPGPQGPPGPLGPLGSTATPPPPAPPVPSQPTPEGAEKAAPPAPPEPAPMAELPPQPGLLEEGPLSKMRVAAWVGVAGTLALLTTGAILGLAAQSRADEISRRFTFVDPSTGQPKTYDAMMAADIANLHSDGELYNGLAIGFYSAAAASAVVTTVLFVVDVKRGRHERRVPTQALRLQPSLGSHQLGASVGWSF